MKIAAISSQKGSFVIKRPRGVRRSQRPRLTGRSTVRVASATVLSGQPLAHEPWRGTRGNREVPPHLWRRGLVGETGFPPRERAEGERRSFSHHRDEPLAELLQEGGRVTPARELFGAQDLDRQLTRGRDPSHRKLSQGAERARDRCRTIFVPNRKLAEQGVVERRHRGARLDEGVQPDTGPQWRPEARDLAGCGREVAGGILGVDPDLDRVAATRCAARRREGLTGGDPHLLAHEVDAGHQLRYRMLDLEARVQLNEVEALVGPEQELEGPGVAVADRRRGALGGRFQRLARLRREAGRGG